MSLWGRLTNILHNDVAKPVQRNVVQPVQRVVQQPRVDVQQLAQALQIIHPNAPPAVHASIIHNLTHNPVTNTAGSLAKGTTQWAAAAPKSLYGDVRVAAADASHNPQARKNALKARNQAETTFASPILRPVVQGIETLAHPFTQHTVTPTSNDAKRLLGDTPIQNINKGVATNYDAHKNLNPVARAALAALYGGGQIAQDIGTVAGLKSGIKPAVSVAENTKPLNEVGAVGKDVSKRPALSKDSPKLPTPSSVAAKPSREVVQKANMGTVKLPNEFNPEVTARLTQDSPSANPLEGKVGVPAAHDAGQAHLNAQFVAQHEQRIGHAAQAELSKLSPSDQNLMRQIQINGVQKLAPKAENPTQFVKTEGALRNYYDLRHAYDRSLGIPTPYRKNYLRDLIPPQEPEANFAVTGGNKRPGYIQRKEAPGATPVAEGLARDIQGSSFNHAKLTYAQGLEEAFPNQISRGSPVTGEAGITQQLNTPYGNELFATKDIARGINERAPAQKAQGAIGKYDTVNAFAKYLKLSGGAFHAFTEGGNFIGQQLASGKLFTKPAESGKLFKAFFSPKALSRETADLESNGALDKARLAGLTWTPEAIKADVNVTPHGLISKYTGLKALHDATFQRELPYIKIKMFEQQTQGLDIHNPEDLIRMRQTASAINNSIGGINRAVQGLTPQQAKVASRFLLATDFTEGKIRTVISALSKGGEEGKIARQVIAGKALVFAGLATGGAALTGELNGKSPEEIAQNILGNFINPTFQSGKNTVSFPATHISEFSKPFASFFNGSKDKFSGLKHYGTSRLAAVPSEVNQLVNNLDYTGNHIYGKNTKKNGGQPFTPAETALNVAKGVLPIPFSQGTAAAQGKQSIPATIGNIAGLRVAPTPTKTAVSSTTTAKQAFGNTQKVFTFNKKQLSAVDFANLSDADKKKAASQDPNARELYKEWQSIKKVGAAPPLLADGLDKQSQQTLTKYNRMTPDGKKNLFANKPEAQYQYDLAKYNNDKLSGNLSNAQDIKAQNNLSKEKVGSAFDKNIRDIYALSKGDIYNFITTDKNGKSVADQANQYDQALKDSGLISKLKFAKGFATATSGPKGRKSSVAKVKLSPLPKVPKVKALKLASGKSKVNKLPFKKYALGGKKTVVKFKGA